MGRRHHHPACAYNKCDPFCTEAPKPCSSCVDLRAQLAESKAECKKAWAAADTRAESFKRVMRERAQERKKLATVTEENTRLQEFLRLLGKGCQQRKVHEEWPALEPLIRKALNRGQRTK